MCPAHNRPSSVQRKEFGLYNCSFLATAMPVPKLGRPRSIVSKRVVSGDGAGVARHASLEHKASARVTDARTDGWLKVVEVEVVLGGAILRSVPALGPAEVDVGGELVVAKEERVCAGGIAKGGKAGERKDRLADIERPGSVGAGDAELVQTKVAVSKIDEGLRACDLAGVTKVPVDNQAGGDDMADAKANILDAAGSLTGLATVDGSAPSAPVPRRSQISVGSVRVYGSMLYRPKMVDLSVGL